MGRTLWTWEHLPKNNEENADTSWLNEGDAVENVNRLKIGKLNFDISSLIIYQHVLYCI